MVSLSHDSFRNGKKRSGTPVGAAATREYVAKRLTEITSGQLAEPQKKAPAKEQRRLGRRSVYRLASIFVSKLDSYRCVVIDLSGDGARITMETDYHLPEYVTLRFDQSCVRRRARIVWRHGRDAGLCFVKHTEEADTD